MSSSVFGEGMTTYASGVSTETPTDALQFLENFTNGRNGTDGIAIDPGSGFPFNPGSQPGLEGIGNLKENVEAIKNKKDERIKDSVENRTSPEDTLTYKYTQDLIDGGVLPGTPGYKTPAQLDAERLAGDLAIRDANDPEFMQERSDQRMSELEALQALNKERRNERSDEIWGEDGSYQAMMELRAANRTPLPSILDFIPRVSELQRPPEGGADPEKPEAPEAPEQNTFKDLPDLLSKPTGGRMEGPDIYTSGGDMPNFKKNPSFDGRNFEYFLERANKMVPGDSEGESTRPDYGNMIPDDKFKNSLYNSLKDAGLSEDEMFKGAQYAGLTNVNSASDVDQILAAVNNNYYADAGKSLKSEEDLFDWYKDQGGTNLNLEDAISEAGFKSYDSEKDANKLIKILTKDLKKSGITAEPNKKDLKQFNRQMDKLENRFGGKLDFKTYQEALANLGADSVNEWVKQYIELGGGVGRKVTDALAPNN